MKRTDGGLTAEETATDPQSLSDDARARVDRYVLAPLRILANDWRALVGILIVSIYLLMGFVAWISASDWWLFSGLTLVTEPVPNQGPRLLQPLEAPAHPLGTDKLGSDILAQIVHATPAMLKMIFAGAVFSTTVATLVGTFAGYKGGVIDTVLMAFADIMMTIPGLPLIIVLAAIFQPRDPFVIGIILTINGWAGLARSLRSQVLTLREESYVEASRAMGIRTHSILGKDIVPNLMPFVAVNFVGTARSVIFSSVALYFLGILPFSNLNWGVMMNLAYQTAGALYTWETAHWLLAPMATIVILSFGLILLAQGGDRIFNPRIRARHAGGPASEEDEDRPTPSPEVTNP